jgi:hypothetical protein
MIGIGRSIRSGLVRLAQRAREIAPLSASQSELFSFAVALDTAAYRTHTLLIRILIG